MTAGTITTVLMIEDNRVDADLLREIFYAWKSDALVLADAASMAEAERTLAMGGIDAVLLDLGLPDSKGLESLNRARTVAPRVPIVVLTGQNDESLAMQALQVGAQDYLIKGQIDTRGIVRALRYAVERKGFEEALYVEKERAQVTLASIGDAVISTDISGRVTFLNSVAATMTGWSSQEAQGQPLADVFRIINATSRKAISTSTGTALLEQRSVSVRSNCILVNRDGAEVPIDDSVAPILDRQGKATGAVVVFRDVSAARALSIKMTHSAEHDSLTGLPNRVLLNDRLTQAIALARRRTKRLAVLFLDLDGFKDINDSLGHSVGDKLLQSIGKRLVDCGRASDTVSRQGGDEFVILLSEVEHSEDAAIAARRVLRAVAQPHFIEDHEVHLTTSIGVSVYPEDGGTAETLVKNADTAMYQAKENGRSSYQFFKRAMSVRAAERQSIEEDLRGALDRSELTLHYQPKMNCRTGSIAGAEALLRWTDAGRGAVPPLQFIPIAEDCGLILRIGNWVLRRACEQAKSWSDSGLPSVTMAVNVSALEFRDPNFVNGLFGILDETGLDPHLLELEVRESVLMKHADSASRVLQTIRRKGVKVALDDFGTGYSSLSYLRDFPIDALKLDRSFVARVTAADEEASIVTAVMSMARSLKLRVVAEGVETSEEMEFLNAHECDEAQGYYFSAAIAPHEFATLLTTGIRPPLGLLV